MTALGDKPLTSALPALLRWEPDDGVIDAVREAYLASLLQRAVELVAEMSTTTLSLMSCIPDDEVVARLTLPAVAGALLSSKSRRSARATLERAMSPSLEARNRPPLEDILGELSRFRVDTVLMVRAEEPYLTLHSSTTAPSAHHTAVANAVETLQRSRPGALRLFCACTKFIALEQQPAMSGSASASWCNRPGLVGLTNASTQPEAWIINAVAHECLHSLLYMVETSEPWFHGARSIGVRIRSPWTGAQLADHSFVHACFVWFGLFHLWSRMGNPSADMYRDAAAAGFVDSERIAIDVRRIENLDVGVVDTIDRMAQTFNGA